MTFLQLITSSLRLIGKLGPGRSAGPSETADALLVLNSMLEAWSIERLDIFSISRDVYDLVVAQQAYTIGPAGNFNAARPLKIERAGIISDSNPSQPLELPLEVLTFAQWADIPVKSVTSTLPQRLYSDGAFPLSNLYVWPVPSITNSIALYTWQALTTGITDTSTAVTFPPGYADAIRYNLAVKLAPEWGLPIRADVMKMAIDSKAAIKSLNVPTLDLKCDAALLGSGQAFNWITGE